MSLLVKLLSDEVDVDVDGSLCLDKVFLGAKNDERAQVLAESHTVGSRFVRNLS